MLSNFHRNNIPNNCSKWRKEKEKRGCWVWFIEEFFRIIDCYLRSLDRNLPETPESDHKNPVPEKELFIERKRESKTCFWFRCGREKKRNSSNDKEYEKIENTNRMDTLVFSEFCSYNRTDNKKDDKYNSRTSTNGRGTEFWGSNFSSDEVIFPDDIETIGETKSNHGNRKEYWMNIWEETSD